MTVNDDCLLRLQIVTERVQISVRLNALAENYVLLLMSSYTNTTFLSFITPLHIGGSHTLLSNCANKFRVIPVGKFWGIYAKNLVPISQRTQFVSIRLMLIMKTTFICYGTRSPQSTQHKCTVWANRSTLSIKVGGTQTPSIFKGFKISSDQSL